MGTSGVLTSISRYSHILSQATSSEDERSIIATKSGQTSEFLNRCWNQYNGDRVQSRSGVERVQSPPAPILTSLEATSTRTTVS